MGKTAKTAQGKAALNNEDATASAQEPLGVGNFVSGLARTLAAANSFLIQHLKESGLTNLVPSHGDILVCLFEGEPISMQQLAERINRDPSTVTALVKKLVAAGYASTSKNKDDHRITEVSITNKGLELRETFERINKELHAVQMSGIDINDFEATCRTLQQIEHNFIQVCK